MATHLTRASLSGINAIAIPRKLRPNKGLEILDKPTKFFPLGARLFKKEPSKQNFCRSFFPLLVQDDQSDHKKNFLSTEFAVNA